MIEPVAEKRNIHLEHHGDIRTDPYYWLNDRKDPDVLSYLRSENTYTDEIMQPSKDLREKLYNEIIGRIKKTDMSAPYMLRAYLYYTKFEDGQEYPIYIRKAGQEGQEEILLDVNELAAPFDYYHAAGLVVSPDDQKLAFAEDTVSRRIYTIRFKDLAGNAFLNYKIENTTGAVAWANDNQTVFYVRRDETLRPFKVFRHVLGSDPAEDVEIFHETDDTFRVGIARSRTGKYIFIRCDSTYSTEYHILSADTPNQGFEVFQAREAQHEYSLEHDHNQFLILTNWQAQNFRLMSAPEGVRSKSAWKPLIDHDPQVLIDDVEAFEHHIVIRDRKDGLPRIRIIDRQNEEHFVVFDEAAYDVDFEINRQYATDLLRINYTSMTTPDTILEYNMKSGTRKVLKQQVVVGDFDPSNYITERVMVSSHDGTQVPLSIVYRQGMKRTGTAPFLLYGYGSYGISIDPYFSSARLSLLDRGVGFAIAHVRGGEELGRSWYEDGKYLKKKNTFRDFIACGEFLIEKKYCHREKLLAMGGSAGGLLMGAVINMAPTLFKAVIAAVPFVDVLTTMLDDSIPLTTGEYSEWGNPNEEEYYHYIKSYSPYENIKETTYPDLLVTTGLHDSQVQYWEPAKWVAKLRDLRTGTNRLLLHTDMDTGHGGASGRFKRFRETALHYAFLLSAVGIE